MFACCFSLGFPKVWPWTSVWLTSAPDRFQTAATSLESPQRPWPDLTLIFDQLCIRYHEILCRGVSDTRDYWISAFTKCLILNFLLDLYHYSQCCFHLKCFCLSFLLRISCAFSFFVKCLKLLLNSMGWWGPTGQTADTVCVNPPVFLQRAFYRLTKCMSTMISVVAWRGYDF